MYKRLLKCVREYKKDSILSPLLVSMEVVLECILPFVIALLVNAIKDGADLGVIYKYAIILVIMAMLSLAFGAAAGVFCARGAAGFAKNLRHDIFYSIQSFSFENIDRFSAPSLVTRLTTDVTNIQMAYMMIIRTAIRAPLMMTFAFIMAFIMGGNMAWVFVVLIPFLAFFLFLIIKKTFPLFKRVFRKYDDLNASIQENIKAIRVVKSFTREEYEKEKFEKSAEDIRKDFTKAERIIAWNMPLMQFCLYVVMIVVLSFGSYTIITTRGLDLDVGQFSALLTYGFMILSSLMMLSFIFVMIAISEESVKRVNEVLNEESTMVSGEETTVPSGEIEYKNVSFRYSSKAKLKVLDDISLKIESGETIGIIGGTGSSKSTLIQLIPRLYDVSEGTLLVGGKNVKDYNIESLRDAVSIVLQKNTLFAGTIKENLRWGDENATDEEIDRACEIACADEFISSLPDGYETKIEQGGTNVSGGQKQRLCIARAILKKPKILILDDSTSAVDTKNDAKIRAGMKNLLPETTKIIIAQRTSSVEDADRIIVMDGGRINEVGTHKYLLENNEIYRDIYISQNKKEADDETA